MWRNEENAFRPRGSPSSTSVHPMTAPLNSSRNVSTSSSIYPSHHYFPSSSYHPSSSSSSRPSTALPIVIPTLRSLYERPPTTAAAAAGGAPSAPSAIPSANASFSDRSVSQPGSNSVVPPQQPYLATSAAALKGGPSPSSHPSFLHTAAAVGGAVRRQGDLVDSRDAIVTQAQTSAPFAASQSSSSQQQQQQVYYHHPSEDAATAQHRMVALETVNLKLQAEVSALRHDLRRTEVENSRLKEHLNAHLTQENFLREQLERVVARQATLLAADSLDGEGAAAADARQLAVQQNKELRQLMDLKENELRLLQQRFCDQQGRLRELEKAVLDRVPPSSHTVPPTPQQAESPSSTTVLSSSFLCSGLSAAEFVSRAVAALQHVTCTPHDALNRSQCGLLAPACARRCLTVAAKGNTEDAAVVASRGYERPVSDLVRELVTTIQQVQSVLVGTSAELLQQWSERELQVLLATEEETRTSSSVGAASRPPALWQEAASEPSLLEQTEMLAGPLVPQTGHHIDPTDAVQMPVVTYPTTVPQQKAPVVTIHRTAPTLKVERTAVHNNNNKNSAAVPLWKAATAAPALPPAAAAVDSSHQHQQQSNDVPRAVTETSHKITVLKGTSPSSPQTAMDQPPTATGSSIRPLDEATLQQQQQQHGSTDVTPHSMRAAMSSSERQTGPMSRSPASHEILAKPQRTPTNPHHNNSPHHQQQQGSQGRSNHSTVVVHGLPSARRTKQTVEQPREECTHQ